MATKGFITVATGKWYCYLAQNLVMSYRLFANCDLPFYVITDKKCEKTLKKYFDGVVVVDNPHYNYLDKIEIYKNTPFDETIFLDADMDIVSDVSFLMGLFEENGSEVSCYGRLRDITDEERPNHFGDVAIKRFNLKQYIAFNGGIYYFKKGEKADKCINDIYNLLIPNYDKLGLLYFRNNQMADEPLMGLSMLINEQMPVFTDFYIMNFVNDVKTIKWDMIHRTCTFIWYGNQISTKIIHFGTHNTFTWKYCYCNALLRYRFKKYSRIFYAPLICIKTVKWALKPRQLKSFFKWFGWHFTPSYWKEKLGRT